MFEINSVSGSENTVMVNVGAGAYPCIAMFYARGNGDTVVVEHRTMKSFGGPKTVPLSDVTVNGKTFTSDVDAVAAINALCVGFNTGGGTSGTTPDSADPTPVPSPLTVRITEMFNILSNAKFIIEQHLPDVDGGDSYIVFRGDDTSGAEESDLVITVPKGYGSAIDKTFPGTTDVATEGVDAQGSPVYNRVSWTAKITKETPTTQSVLTIPKEAIEVDFFWFVGQGEDGGDLIADSYWVDTNGTRHPFNLENTPPDNLIYGQATINGVSIDPSHIREIHFLDDYPMVEAPDAFLNRAAFCEKLTLPTGLVKVGDSFLEQIGSGLTEGVERIVFPRGLTTVGMYALYAAKSPYVELPQGLESIGPEFCNLRSGSPRELQIGSLNAEGIAGDTTGAFGQNPEFTIYADTLELGEAFKAKFTALANCPVVVNE